MAIHKLNPRDVRRFRQTKLRPALFAELLAAGVVEGTQLRTAQMRYLGRLRRPRWQLSPRAQRVWDEAIDKTELVQAIHKEVGCECLVIASSGEVLWPTDFKPSEPTEASDGFLEKEDENWVDVHEARVQVDDAGFPIRVRYSPQQSSEGIRVAICNHFEGVAKFTGNSQVLGNGTVVAELDFRAANPLDDVVT